MAEIRFVVKTAFCSTKQNVSVNSALVTSEAFNKRGCARLHGLSALRLIYSLVGLCGLVVLILKVELAVEGILAAVTLQSCGCDVAHSYPNVSFLIRLTVLTLQTSKCFYL